MLDILVKLIPESSFRNRYFQKPAGLAYFGGEPRGSIAHLQVSVLGHRWAIPTRPGPQREVVVVHHYSVSCEPWVTTASCLNLVLIQLSTTPAAET